MADIRIIRHPTDNKVRNFTPLPNTHQTLHIRAPDNATATGNSATFELFLTSHPRDHDKINPAVSSSLQHLTTSDKVCPVSSKEVTHCQNYERDDEKDHTLPSPKLTSCKANTVTSPKINVTDQGVNINCPTWVSDAKGSCNPFENVGVGGNGKASFSKELSKLDASATHQALDRKSAIPKDVTRRGQPFCSLSHMSVDNSLVDVHQEELELPDVNNPTGVFLSPTKHPTTTLKKVPNGVGGRYLPLTKQPGMSINNPSIQNASNSHRFKRSVSSFDFQNSEYKSFFGSLRSRAVHHQEEEEEKEKEEEFDDDNDEGPDYTSFSALWDLRRAWMFESPLHRAQSADSFMQMGKKARKASPIDANSSQTAVEHLDEERVEVSDKHGDTKLLAKPNENCDRLKMRRGALAQPERMIMSQEIREKVERDVEKRKASMVRRVSQFLNVQLGLNREEDLI